MMAEREIDLRRWRPVFVLERLSPRLRSDVLADGSIASLCELTMKRPTAHVTSEIVVIRDELFAAFRSTTDSPAVHQLHDKNGALVDATISINQDGSGTVDIAETKVCFPWVTLLSSSIEKRLSELETFLSRYPLCERDAASLRTVLARPTYSDDDFLAIVEMLESSPEAFAERFNQKLRRQGQNHRIGPDDVLPGDVRYWDHLIAPVEGSVTLAEYIEKELRETWSRRLDKNPAQAFHSMATTFGAPALIPRALLQSLDANAAAAMIDLTAELEDPFSLEGAFEICADRVGQDQRFVALGDRLLDRLFADMGRLTGSCALYGAIFVIATAYLGEHETLQHRPVYWRRLAAAVHAALIVRVCGNGGIDPDEMISWAMRVSGEIYFLSVLSDFVAEPQWRPEWIVPKFLVADVFGRALAAWHRIPQGSGPPSWKKGIEKAYAWILQEKIGPLAHYPAVLEGTRRPHRPTLAEFKAAKFEAAVDAFRGLANDPSAERLLAISPFIEAFGFPDEATDDVVKVLDSIRATAPNADDKDIVLALSVVAHIAVLSDSRALADKVSEVCLERTRTVETSGSIFEIVARLVECAAVIQDRNEARQTLARRLEILAFIVPASESIGGFLSAIEKLKRVQPELAPLLGRALAAARLGISRPTAA